MNTEIVQYELQKMEYSFEDFRRRIHQPLEEAGVEPASARSHRLTDDMRNYLLRFFQVARFAPLVAAYNEEAMEYWWQTVQEVVNHVLFEVRGPNGVPEAFLRQATKVSINDKTPFLLNLSYTGRAISMDVIDFPIAVTVPAISTHRPRDLVDIQSTYNWSKIPKEIDHFNTAADAIKRKISVSSQRITSMMNSHSSTGQMLKALTEWDRKLMELAIDAFFCNDRFTNIHVILDEELYNRSAANVFFPVGLGYKSPVVRTAKMPPKLQSRPLPVATQFLDKPPMEAFPQPIDERHRQIVERACEVNKALEMLFEAMGEDCALAQSSKRRLITDLTGPIIQSAVS